MIFKAIILSVLLLATTFGIVKIINFENKKNEVIKVKISLVNKCELYDKAFMVKAIPSQKTAKFSDGVAIMYLKRSSKVMLAVNDDYPGFHFTSIPKNVAYNTKLIADCSNSERLDNIFDSLRNQFNKNSD